MPSQRQEQVYSLNSQELADTAEDDKDKVLCSPCGLDGKAHRRQHNIIAGSIRAPHRLKYTGRIANHQCPHPGCQAARCDTEHLLWTFTSFVHARAPFLKAIANIISNLDSKAKYRANVLRDLIRNKYLPKMRPLHDLMVCTYLKMWN